jgi:hypothetical protein
MPLGGVEITVVRKDGNPPIPLSKINQLEEGDRIVYAPSLRPHEKRRGDVAIVLVPSRPDPEQKQNFVILEQKDAEKPAQWTVSFRSSLAAYVYGPSGLSTRKLRGFLAKDQELVAQLADYAEKTKQTEEVLQALATYEDSGSTENLGAALQGFAGQYGLDGKIDRNAPLNQQTMDAMRTLNPALSAFDPISPSGSQRVSQTTGLATIVAGMFLGSTVGLAAGGAALGLNLKTLVFPDTDFRSAYAQKATGNTVSLCTSRTPSKSRTRLAYLWAMRLPDSGPPQAKIEEPNHVPIGLKSILNIRAPEGQWKLANRVREWKLKGDDGTAVPAQVIPILDQQRLELNLADVSVRPGRYTLSGLWDWDSFGLGGEIFVDELASFREARLTSESQNRLRQGSGKQVVNLTGGDFQFVEKAAIVKKDDKYATPAAVPFTLPKGPKRGSQDLLEMQVDTSTLDAGKYSLLLYQADGKPQAVDVKVLADPPRIERLPLIVNEGEKEQRLVLEGDGLDRITAVTANGLQFELDSAENAAKRRGVTIRQSEPLKQGTVLDVSLSIRDYAQPIVLSDALNVAAARPRIRSANASLPADLPIALRTGELPAGIQIGVMLDVSEAGSEPAVRLGCKDNRTEVVRVGAGSEKNRVKLSAMQEHTLFLSLDPGFWPTGCQITAVLEKRGAGDSEPFELGRVLRLPQVEKFELTDEALGDGSYVGILIGRDLELIGRTGWEAKAGHDVLGLPSPISGEGNRQSLRIRVPWPSPTPRAPLFVWFRGEQEGRATKVRF